MSESFWDKVQPGETLGQAWSRVEVEEWERKIAAAREQGMQEGVAAAQDYLGLRQDERRCERCGGFGRRMYPDTRTWRGPGVGGQACTVDVCDACWGTGSAERKGVDLLALTREVAQARMQGRREGMEEAAEYLEARNAKLSLYSVQVRDAAVTLRTMAKHTTKAETKR